MSRSVEEWIGKSDDTPVPPRVRLRVFERYGGRCYKSGRLIRPGDRWECDHVIAIGNGGENRENNLAPLLLDKHREKTRQDVKTKAKIASTAKKHAGIRAKPKRPWPKRGFDKRFRKRMDGTVERREE